MSHIIRDGFDFYGAPAEASINFWDAQPNAGTWVLSNLTRFGVGQAGRFPVAGSQSFFSKATGSNQAVQFVACALFNEVTSAATSQATIFQWLDGATVQCSVIFKINGDCEVRRGGTTGTLLTTFTAVIPAATWTHVQIKVVIDPTVGECHIRLNGDSSDDFSITGQNTRSSANSFANVVQLGTTTSSSTQWRFDDLWFFDGNAAGQPHDFIGDVRAIQLMPNADGGTNQFTPNATTVTTAAATVSATVAILANTMQTININPQVFPAGTLNSLVIPFNAAMTGNAIIALYDSDGPGGIPGTFLAATAQVTNPVINNNTFTFASPPTVLGNHNYWLVILTSAAATLKAPNGTGTIYRQAQAFTTTPPNIAGPSTTNLAQVSYTCTLTPTAHYGFVQEAISDDAFTTLNDATVNDVENFTSAGLPVTPSAILGVSVRAMAAKSDAGARSGGVLMTSGASTVNGTSTALSTGFGNLNLVQDTDPNTSAAWTATGVNNLKFGAKVTA